MHELPVLGATRDEVLFVAVLVGMTLLGTYVGSLGESLYRLLRTRDRR
ncbi:MAG: hypothetical protein U0271_04690 [Polyangiaceae bacterium]